jgi:hypothetical protein
MGLDSEESDEKPRTKASPWAKIIISISAFICSFGFLVMLLAAIHAFT